LKDVTYKLVVPAVAVEIVGCVEELAPPVGTVYHLNDVPAAGVADNAEGVSFKQKFTGVVTIGLAGVAFTVTVMDERVELSQPDAFTEATKNVVLPAVVVLGVGAPARSVPAALYQRKVAPAGGVAVNVVAPSPTQYETVGLTEGAMGNAFTVTVMVERVLSHCVLAL
jgi:hypothetical protein